MLDKAAEKYTPQTEGIEVDKLSVDEAKARCSTLETQLKAASTEIKEMRDGIMRKMAEAKGDTKKKLSEILLKAGTITQKIEAEKQAATKAISSAEQRAATADVREQVTSATKALNKAIEVADNLDDVGAEKVQKSLETARVAVTAASKAVYERLQSVTGANAATSPMNQAIKRALAELMVENNQSETKLRQAQTKVEGLIEAARIKTVMKEFNDKVAEADAKSEEIVKLITPPEGEKRTAEA